LQAERQSTEDIKRYGVLQMLKVGEADGEIEMAHVLYWEFELF
jgi:hypothetical protein